MRVRAVVADLGALCLDLTGDLAGAVASGGLVRSTADRD
jgi:isoaspartyl peptidase/L-asparaginase-like protein (Ntn-hydrolase superfamily)